MKKKDFSGSFYLFVMLIVNIAAIAFLFSVMQINKAKATAMDAPVPEYTSPAVSSEVISDGASQSEEAPVNSADIRISAFADYVTVGASVKLEVTASDGSAPEVIWTSENEEIARVYEDGTVEGVSRGCAIIKAATADGSAAVYEIFVMNPGLVFLSPSRQTGNMYYDNSTDECEQAFRMSGACKARLEAVGLEVYECPIEYGLRYRGEDAAEMGAKCYVAIHTNAAGDQTGTTAFFNRRTEGSIRLAKSVYETVAPITPDSDAGIRNGVTGSGRAYIEIKYPHEAGVPSTLLEVDYHDREASARWLIENTELIGSSIADGIMRFMYESY